MGMILKTVTNLGGNDCHGVGFDLAHVDVARHHEETVHAPGGSPRVAADPNGFAVVSGVTDQVDGVVHLSTAARATINSTSVLAKVVVSHDGNGENPVCIEGSHDGVGVGRNVNIRGNAGTDSCGVESTAALLSLVSVVVGFGLSTGALDVVPGVGRPSTVASVIDTVAINQLLFTQSDGLTVLSAVGEFECGSGRKGPAASATSLISGSLHAGAGTVVNGSWSTTFSERFSPFAAGSVRGPSSEKSLEFLWVQVRKYIVSHGVGEFLGVVGFDFLVDSGKVGFTFVMLREVMSFGMLNLVFFPVSVDFAIEDVGVRGHNHAGQHESNRVLHHLESVKSRFS